MSEYPDNVRVGFSGSQEGMTDPQKAALHLWLISMFHEGAAFHHGDCIGADAQAGRMAWNLGYRVVVHPPTDPKKRAFVMPMDELREPKWYLLRNHDIVNETGQLVAAPSGAEKQRSGTWATVRYARKHGKPVTVVWPDGALTEPG